MNKESDPFTRLAEGNNNRCYDVKGTVELADDGYVEVNLTAEDGSGQILHLHRYTDGTGKGKVIGWDCWVFENKGNVRRHHCMSEKNKKVGK
ncbi:hypothetical protein COT30_00700 [Candidatus Micrarchaeota archaeon CG08_land_8_20_14_0_20_49_17]|nr:MAG: hypothetical protein AUJ13_02395 [Candidatus Micrarchaeota archaeon CG1_02_49_24]PIU10161.1 MAG: hypothetical protein COT30_00700 [Candidatus Micrarchaeota archaeon CG08_land_8_20_14_0_20_49_17]PIU81579.1 MAG: hypothetical protein COS70_03335 [Candidatus Micrarchaeota archaeon CG06_land_8_20_14_3_00_50_6]HII54234.1 hypothetical protein [Candidatus Micrarchaeota archaeon]